MIRIINICFMYCIVIIIIQLSFVSTKTEAESTFIEELWIDTIDPTVKSGSQILENDVTYLITIEGTHSYYIVSKYEEWIGTPEARPIFYDGEIQYCYVGADAGYKFSCIGEYGYTVESLPILTPNIKFSFDSGITWYNNYIKQYNSNHIYQFVYKGKGFPLKIKFHDSYYSDNYGKYKIIIEKDKYKDDYPNTCDSAHPITLNQTINAKIDYPGQNDEDGDCDYFKIDIPDQMTVSIYTSGDTDTYGILYSCCNGSPPDCPIRMDDNDSGENSNFKIKTTLDSGDYYLKIRHNSVEGTGDYQIICENSDMLLITYPTYDSIWKIGETQTIKWQPGSINEPVSIYISYLGLSNSTFMLITDNTDNDGEYELHVSGFPTNNCIIRIEPVNNPQNGVNSSEFIVHDSPNMLEIYEPCKNLIRHYSIGEQQTITWNWTDIEGNVNIYLSRKSGMKGTYEILGENIDTRGFHLWTPVDPPSKSNIIKVESVNDPSFYGLSGYFTIDSVVDNSMMFAELENINPNKDETITANYTVKFLSKYFQTIEIDFDGDGIIDSTTPANIRSYSHIFPEQDIYYSTITGITDCQKITKRICVDTRIGKSELSVFLYDAHTYLPINDAHILLDNKIDIPFSPDLIYFFFLDNLVPTNYMMSINTTNYFNYNFSIKLDKGSNVKSIRLIPKYTPSKYPDICEIRIYVPKGTFLNNTKEVIYPKFLSGITVDSIFKLNVLWGNVEPSKIKYFNPQSNESFYKNWDDVKEKGLEFDPGNLNPGDELCFQAIDALDETSDIKCAKMEIVPVPLIKSSMIWKDGKYVGIEAFLFNNIKQSIGSSRIPQKIPLIGNQETSFNVPFDFSRDVEIDGKGRITSAFSVDKNEGSKYKRDKYFQFAGKRVPLLEKKKGVRRYQAEKGEGISLKPNINIEMEWKNNEWNYQGGVGFEAKGDWKTPPYYFWATPPLYARLGLNVRLNAQFDFLGVEIPDHLEKDYPLNIHGGVGISPSGSISTGVGASDILSGELKGTVGLDWVLDFTVEKIYNKKLDFLLKCDAEMRVFFFKQNIPISSCQWDLLKGTNDCNLKNQFNLTSESILNADDFVLFPRDYLNNRYQRIPDLKTSKTTKQDSTSLRETIILENVYPYSDTSIVSHNVTTNGIVVLFIADEPKRSSANRTCLKSMNINDHGAITDISTVIDNGTADFHPSATTLPNGQILAVWNDTKSQQTDTVSLEDMLGHMEIASAIFEPYSNTWKSLGRITNNEILDRNPSLYLIPDGKVAAVWISNQFNLYMADAEHPDSINIAIFQDEKWTITQNIGTSNGAIFHITVGYYKNQLFVIWDEDTDGNLSTVEDRELFMCTQTEKNWNLPQRLTNDNEIDTFPNILTTSENDLLLIWGRSDNIVCAENFQITKTTIIAHNIGTTAIADLKIISRKPSGASLIWTDTYDNGGSNIYVALYDDKEKLWGTPKQLIEDTDMEQRIDGIYQTDNILTIVYNKVRLKMDTDLGLIPEMTDLAMCTFHEGTDLAIIDLLLSNDTPTPFENIEITASVMNLGDKVMSKIPVKFFVGDSVIETDEISYPLAPGNFIEITALCTLPEIPGITIAARVDPDNILEDKDHTNNYMLKSVIKPNITARGVTYEILPDNQMLLKVQLVNKGTADSKQFMISLVQEHNYRENIYKREIINGLMLSEIQDRQWIVPQGKYLLYLDHSNLIDEEDEADNIYGYKASHFVDEPVFLLPEIFDDYHCKLSIYIPISYTDVSNISWDLDNDGVFELCTSENSIDYTFSNIGIYMVNAKLHRYNNEDIDFNGVTLKVYNCDGDFDSNGSINLSDIIYALRLICNDSVSIKSQCSDTNNNHCIGIEDIIYTFKLIAESDL